MKYSTTTLTALAVRTAGPPVDPFVSCMQKTYPLFPKEGNPTSEAIRTCFDHSRPQEKRENVPADPTLRTLHYEPNNITQITPRGFADTAHVLGKVLGIGAQPVCQEPDGVDSTLHDEFVWTKDVIALADAVCEDANNYLKKTGLNEKGGAGLAIRELTNAHDWQSGTLKNGRKLLLTLATTVLPGRGLAPGSVEAIAQGVFGVCSAGILRLLNSKNGCSRNVRWYVSNKAKFEHELAAIGGVLDIFLGSATSPVASMRIGFSEDKD